MTRHFRATQALAWVRMALPRGLACHVASTRVSRENKPVFVIFLILLIDLKSKINLENPENSLKIRKFIIFKIQLQINPDFFHWI